MKIARMALERARLAAALAGVLARAAAPLLRRAGPSSVLLALAAAPLAAQAPERADSAASDSAAPAVRTRVTGYLEHQFGASRSRGRWTQLDHDRLRADLVARAGRGVRLEAAAIWQLYRGDTHVRLRDQLPASVAASLDTASLVIEDRHFVNHAYLVLSPGGVEITAGKQYLTWGAAWVFNPTELFRPKDLFEPTYEREGVGALSARLPLGALSDVLVAYVPDGPFRTSGKVARARHHVAGFDVSALAAAVYERPAATPAGAASTASRRLVLGGDLSGEVLGLGVWAEGTWNDFAGDRWAEATLGGNYTLPDRTLLLVEGYFNGRGRPGDPYPAAAWLARLAGERRSLGRFVVYVAANRPVREVWRLGVGALVNPGDGSAALVPSVAWEFAENVELIANGLVSIGADGTEYGRGGVGGFVRGRVYF
jgi:hypothetical protein